MSQEESKIILAQLRKQATKLVTPGKQQAANRVIDTRVAAEKADVKAETFPLEAVEDRILDIKQRPSQIEYRGRHVGREALATIAKRALVGIARLRVSRELVIYDSMPVPEGEYEIIPLSLVKNPDGTGDLLVTELSQKVHLAQDMTVHAASTEVVITPKLSITNTAKYLFIQNTGANRIYVTYDGEYDATTDTTTGATTPADGIGALLQGTGTLTIDHLIKANPRMISPTGDQTVNIVVSR